LVFEYQVEGLAPQTLDWVEYTQAKQQPLCVRFDGAHDADGDGYIAVSSGVSADSRIKHTRLSVIYVLPQGTSVPQEEAIFSGAMNSQCVWHIDVGATPEQGPANQDYDKSDLGFARLKLRYAAAVPPNTTHTVWFRVPPIHRRQPVSMGYMAHAFRDVLPGEFDHAYRDQAYVIYALDLAGLHEQAERLLRVYCMDVAVVPKGPIAFDGKPPQLLLCIYRHGREYAQLGRRLCQRDCRRRSAALLGGRSVGQLVPPIICVRGWCRSVDHSGHVPPLAGSGPTGVSVRLDNPLRRPGSADSARS
jgi:hypothetical protein